MPVQLADATTDTVGPYSRLSASQVNTYKACPRLWYYEKVLRFRMPQIPVLFVGRAVEEAVCRVLRESPALIHASAPADAHDPSPLDEDGLPDRETTGGWPSQMLMPLPERDVPGSKEELLDWAMARCEQHLPVALERVRLDWEGDDRRAGDWKSVDTNRCLEMTKAGLRFHIDEVERCFTEKGGPSLQSWRDGKRPHWPAPDGFSFPSFSSGHPFAASGDPSWLESWELSRPWFVDPDAAKFSMNAIHPDHWFQGEYDLVYSWDGTVTIVDLKASLGANDRSGDYVRQLRMYAMLWYITHGRSETVGALQIWYLGHPSIKDIDVPSLDELRQMEEELQEMWVELKQEQPIRENCPPEPAPMRGFAPGGKPKDPPKLVRCDRCDWQDVCPSGGGSDDAPLPETIQLPGFSGMTRIDDIGSLNPRASIRGQLFSVSVPTGGRPPKIVIQQGHYFANVNIISHEHRDGGNTWPEGLKKGDEVLVEDAIFSTNWKGEIVLKIDPFARVVQDDSPADESHDLMAYNARRNVGGRIVYTYEKSGVGRNGKTWRRRGLMLMDHTGAMKVEGWFDDWNNQFGMVEVGDIVVIANLGLDAWASEVRGDYSKQSRLQIIERVDRSTS